MDSLQEQLIGLREQINKLKGLLAISEKQATASSLLKQTMAADFWNTPETAQEVSKRLSQIQNIIADWETLHTNIEDAIELHTLGEDITSQLTSLTAEYTQLERFTLFDGKHDEENAIVSMYAGVGGTEAQDWVGMLLRMITRYAEKKEWNVTILDESKGQEAGYKSITLRIAGPMAYGHLQSEHGTHRLVRISPFDAESMRHTSFANIEVIPEIQQNEVVTIDPKELRIDTFMSSGKGGQSVNTTYSAVRVVHIPTGLAVSCQNERSQIQNKETALRILQSKLQLIQEEKEEAERLALRGEVKKAEWGSQIRSYVLHPYKMVKDVRTKQESNDPDTVLDGELDNFIEAYLRYKKQH